MDHATPQRSLSDSSTDLAAGIRRAWQSESADVVMPSFTHLQRAQPISAGAEALAWAAMFDATTIDCVDARTIERIRCPLGSGAIAGTSLPIDPTHIEQLADDATASSAMTAIRRARSNSIEHTASRDVALRLRLRLRHDRPAPLPLGRAVDHLHDHRVRLHQDRRPVHDRRRR